MSTSNTDFDNPTMRDGVDGYTGNSRARRGGTPPITVVGRRARTEWFSVTQPGDIDPDQVLVLDGKVSILDIDSSSKWPLELSPLSDVVTISDTAGFICLALEIEESVTGAPVDPGDPPQDEHILLAWHLNGTERDSSSERVESADNPGTYFNGANLFRRTREVKLATPHYIFTTTPTFGQIILAEVTETATDVFRVDQRHVGLLTYHIPPYFYGDGSP